jgi:DNA polymerase I-like protein with 3'-5' exonuclease and polymerase domains
MYHKVMINTGNIKKYVKVYGLDELREMIEHIDSHEVLSFDVEATGVNPRKDQIIGFSVSGEFGVGYYIPILVYDKETDSLLDFYIEGRTVKSFVKDLLLKLKGKKLVAHNASYDLQITRNNFGVDLLEDLWVDTIMLVHTVSEDGVGDEDATEIEKNFRLKDIAIAIQDKLGLDVSQDANIEQQKMKASILANGGTVTKTSFQIYKADLDLLAEYGAADTDLTLRVCYYYLGLLAEEKLEDFFFVDEVMPLYKEVTIPMEMRGLALDIPLMHRIDTHGGFRCS